MTVTLKKIGGSLAVLIPRAVVSESNLREGDSLNIVSTESGLLFQHTRRPRRSIRKIAGRITPSAYAKRNKELRQDVPVGREVG